MEAILWYFSYLQVEWYVLIRTINLLTKRWTDLGAPGRQTVQGNHVCICAIDFKPRMANLLTHWGRVTHICVSKLTIIGSDNGFAPDRRQAINWTNAGILLIGPMGTNCSEILIEIHAFSFKTMHFKMSSGKWRPFCVGLNVLNGAASFYYGILQPIGHNTK